MAIYNQLSYGSTGDDVKKLQELLNASGNYNLDVDGNFGTKTQSAVKQYQQQNNLEVDGIVGTNTWGALTKSQNASTGTPEAAEPSKPQTETPATPQYGTYTPSDTVAQAQALLQQQLANKPGDYSSTWQSQLNETIAQILNRDKFSYDLNADALYQQYKDQYDTQGQLAMMDTMGQAAALTGGYGNSYAQMAGQQAYQGYLQRLNEVVPELYGMARDQYNQEGQALYDQASLMASMEDQDYGRYRDSLSDYYAELERLTEDARYQGELDYGKWVDNRNFDYQLDRDKVSDSQWQAEFDEAKRQYDQQYALSASKSSGGSDGGDDKDGNDYNEEGYSSNIVKQAQAKVGASVDGYWGEDSAARAKKLGYNSLAEVVAAYQLSDKTGYSKDARNIAIEDWVAKMLANVNTPSFDPERFINSSSFLTTDAERKYALEVLQAYYN